MIFKKLKNYNGINSIIKKNSNFKSLKYTEKVN